MPRVIAGECKGLMLKAPKGERTRPTTDKVKEALFSILQREIPDALFLDLFAGSGQIGIEAVSRGAKSAVLVDENRDAVAAINENIQKTRLESKIRLIRRDVLAALRELGSGPDTFDIVYMDPPYDLAVTMFRKIAESLCERKLLSPGAVVILEHRAEDTVPENVINLTFYRRCKYGTTMLTFYTTDTCYSGGTPSA